MKIEVREDGTLELSEVYGGVGIRTDQGLFGIAQRDAGIEVMLDGKVVWSSSDLAELYPGPPVPRLLGPRLGDPTGLRVACWRCSATLTASGSPRLRLDYSIWGPRCALSAFGACWNCSAEQDWASFAKIQPALLALAKRDAANGEETQPSLQSWFPADLSCTSEQDWASALGTVTGRDPEPVAVSDVVGVGEGDAAGD
jgi:hypothetical protein